MEGLNKSELQAVSNDIKEILSRIEEQFEDHLSAINENTSEIVSIYEGLSDVDSKVEKVAERLDRIETFLQTLGFPANIGEKKFSIAPLSKKEKEIFLVISTANNAMGFVSYTDISRRTAIPEDLVALYISGMMQKGIPFVKKYNSNKLLLKLDDTFREKQAKENILQIEQRTISSMI